MGTVISQAKIGSVKVGSESNSRALKSLLPVDKICPDPLWIASAWS